MKNLAAVILPVLVLSLRAGAARADSVTIGASKDNSIYQEFATNSGGGSAGIFAGSTAGGSLRRGLLAFDVAGNVPAGATISSAQLTLYLGKIGGASSQSIALHRLTADWGEGTAGSSNPSITNAGMGYAAGPGDATWTARLFGATAWSNPGGVGDFVAAASATAAVAPTVVPPTPTTWLSTPVLVSDVQGWLDNPASNFGWMLIHTNEAASGTALAFYSRTADTDAGGDPLDPIARPALSITYTVIPEPAAGVLLLIAGPLVYARRRRP
jgi:MprA protease rhombosortase-interaction domain-containing protein